MNNTFAILTCLIGAVGADVPAASVSFRNDVMPVISKAGCNLGTCHGNATGKGGFKLSLREDDPDFDYRALTRDQFGRRVNLLEPEQSLILQKPTQELAHEGGRRFAPDSRDYRVLRDWIELGAPRTIPGDAKLIRIEVSPKTLIVRHPDERAQLKVLAHFSDGASRDVTGIAVYDPAEIGLVDITPDGVVRRRSFGEATVLVRYQNQKAPVRLTFIPARPDFRWSDPPRNNFVDDFVFARLRDRRVNPSTQCSDEIFLRRASLDLLGILPTAEEARAFVADRAADKRKKLIGELLARPEFADFWALKWADLLKVEDRTLDHKGMRLFHQWIRESIARNKPWNEFAREIVSALGSTYDHPPANFYRANRQAALRAKDTAQVFLGTRLQCAECHNHPFDRWTQADYYDWSAVFGRIDYKVITNRRRDKNDKHEFKGEQIVYLKKDARVTNPQTEETARPRLLGADSALVAGNELSALGDWVASAGNPYFARAQANRVWYHLMGRGLVEPIDDFRDTNPATHPELLAALADEFVGSGFDLRRLITTIMTSRAYQLGSVPTPENRNEEALYAFTAIRRLTAEQLFDAQRQVTGVPAAIPGYPTGLRIAQLPLPVRQQYRDRTRTDAEKFMDLFGKPKRTIVCECERSPDITMSQAFALISGPGLNTQLADDNGVIAGLTRREKNDARLLDELYWRALTRPPTPAESQAALMHLKRAKDRRAAVEDIAWSLLNAKEFIFRQ